jgi:hypothetical protein
MIMIEAMSVRLGMVSLWREGASAECGAMSSGLGRERYSDPAPEGKKLHRVPGTSRAVRAGARIELERLGRWW